jgi:hypothetical protein
MDVDAPPPRDYAQETRETLNAQIELAPARFAAESRFGPQYTDLAGNNIRRLLLGSDKAPGLLSTLREVSPQMQSLQSDAELAQRQRDIASVEQLGGRAVQALRQSDPQQAALLDALNRDAQAGLDAGTGLTESEANQMTQNIRASQAARGFGMGLPDSVLESYTLGDRGRQIQNERRGFASGVARLNAATGQDPFMAVLGRPSQSVAQGQAFLGQGQSAAQGAGPSLFNPESSYAADVFNTNYNGQAAADIAQANATSSIIAGGLSAL